MTAPCPICREPAQTSFRPFCSRRCADIDLGRWLRGSYVVPGEDGDAAEETAGVRPTGRREPADEPFDD